MSGQPDIRIFKLNPNGEAYNAVIKVHGAVTSLMNNMRHYDGDAEDFGRQIKARMLEWDPAVIEKTGLSTPVIQISDHDLQGHPRAYAHTPRVYLTEYKYKHAPDIGENKLDLYMFCPVGYDGQSFVPKDSRLIDNPEEEKFVHGVLFAGGWVDPMGLFSLKPRGVDTPQDYVREASEENQHTKICFIAQGRSFDLLSDLDRRSEEYKGKVDAVNNEIVRIIETDLAPLIKAQMEEGEEFYVNTENKIPRNTSEKTTFEVSVRHEGNIHVAKGGQPLEFPNNDIFFAEETHAHTYAITPNTQNPLGVKTQILMDDVPTAPQIYDYPELLGNFTFTPGEFDVLVGLNGVAPQIDDIEGARILVYRTDAPAEGQSFLPPDAIPLHAPLYIWLKQDQEDMQFAVKPPPLPEDLHQELTMLQGKLNERLLDTNHHIPLLQM